MDISHAKNVALVCWCVEMMIGVRVNIRLLAHWAVFGRGF